MRFERRVLVSYLAGNKTMGTVIRVSVSLKMDESSKIYQETIHPLREEKQLTTVLMHLLEIYHENEEIAAQVKDKMTGDNVEFLGVLLDQFDRIAREHNKTSMAIEAIKDAVSTSKGRVFDFDTSNYNPSSEEINNRSNEVLATLQLPMPNNIQPTTQENSIESLSAQVATLTQMMAQMMQGTLPVVQTNPVVQTLDDSVKSVVDVVATPTPVYTQEVVNTVGNSDVRLPGTDNLSQVGDNSVDTVDTKTITPLPQEAAVSSVVEGANPTLTNQPRVSHQPITMTSETPLSRPASFGKLAQSVR